MNEIYKIDTISDLNKMLNQGEVKHPLVTVIDFSKMENYGEMEARITSGFYSIMMKNDCLAKIETELAQNIDKHSQTLIVSNIELLLNYCTRYYDRQFITRTNSNKGVLSKFENILSAYFASDAIKINGLPSVKYCAQTLNLSANYLSDLLKRETGKNAQDHIHYYLIEEAKNRLMGTTGSVSEIAYELGFDYPQYFSKIFKRKTGMSPAEYRNVN